MRAMRAMRAMRSRRDEGDEDDDEGDGRQLGGFDGGRPAAPQPFLHLFPATCPERYRGYAAFSRATVARGSRGSITRRAWPLRRGPVFLTSWITAMYAGSRHFHA